MNNLKVSPLLLCIVTIHCHTHPLSGKCSICSEQCHAWPIIFPLLGSWSADLAAMIILTWIKHIGVLSALVIVVNWDIIYMISHSKRGHTHLASLCLIPISPDPLCEYCCFPTNRRIRAKLDPNPSHTTLLIPSLGVTNTLTIISTLKDVNKLNCRIKAIYSN